MATLLAIVAGALVTLSMSLNSNLGLRIGVFRATVVNYVVGLTGAFVVLGVLGGPALPDLATVPWWCWVGGLLGVAIVASSNVVLPRIPVVTSTILLFLGQIGTALVIDAWHQDSVAPLRLVGAALVLGGLFVSQIQKRP